MRKHVIKAVFYCLLALSALCVFTACHNNDTNGCTDKQELAQTEGLHIAGLVLHWDAVDSASGYQIKINNYTEPVSDIFYDFSNRLTEYGDYSLSVRAKGDGENYTDGKWAEALLYTFKRQAIKLADPVLSYDSGSLIMSWQIIANASGYKYSVDGADPLFLAADTFSIDLYHYNAGEHSFALIACGDGESSLDSEAAILSFYIIASGQLPAPKPSFNAVNKVISWAQVHNASGYAIQTQEGAINLVSADTLSLDVSDLDLNKQFIFSITAKGEGDFLDSETVHMPFPNPTMTLNKPLLTADILMNWLYCPIQRGVTTYMLRGENIAESAEISGRISGANVFFDAGYIAFLSAEGKYRLTLEAIGDGIRFFDSGKSDAVEFTVYNYVHTPEIMLEGNILSWQEAENVVYYKLYSSGVELLTVGLAYGYTNPLDLSTVDELKNPQEYNLTIKAFGLNQQKSEMSNAVIYRCTKKLDAPILDFIAAIEVLIWQPVEFATGYRYTIDGSDEFTGTINFIDFSLFSPAVYLIRLRALGDGNLYLDSDYAELLITVSKKPLAKPILKQENGFIIWDAVPNAVSYQYRKNLDNAVNIYNLRSLNIADLNLSAGDMIYVKAIADSSLNLDSAWSTPYFYEGTAPGSIYADTDYTIEISKELPFAVFAFTPSLSGLYTLKFDNTAQALPKAGIYSDAALSQLFAECTDAETGLTVYETNKYYIKITSQNTISSVTFRIIDNQQYLPVYMAFEFNTSGANSFTYTATRSAKFLLKSLPSVQISVMVYNNGINRFMASNSSYLIINVSKGERVDIGLYGYSQTSGTLYVTTSIFTQIQAGDNQITALKTNQYGFYSFTPAESGTYKFLSGNSSAGCGIYSDETLNISNRIASGSFGINLTVTLTAGVTYYILTDYFFIDKDVIYNLSVTKV